MDEPRMPRHDEIARYAYRLWEARGCPIGSPEIDWFRAQQELLSDREDTSEHSDSLK